MREIWDGWDNRNNISPKAQHGVCKESKVKLKVKHVKRQELRLSSKSDSKTGKDATPEIADFRLWIENYFFSD